MIQRINHQLRTRYWVEINEKSRGTYDYNGDIKFKTSMLRSILGAYSDTNIHLKLIFKKMCSVN